MTPALLGEFIGINNFIKEINLKTKDSQTSKNYISKELSSLNQTFNKLFDLNGEFKIEINQRKISKLI